MLLSLLSPLTSRSYASISALPVVLLTPRRMAVYLPGLRSMRIADSALLGGRRFMGMEPALAACCQLSLEAMTAPLASCNSKKGLTNTPGTLKGGCAKVGPRARQSTVL